MKLKNPNLFREQCYIDGQWIEANNGATFAVTNPFDGSKIGVVPQCGAKETEKAIAAADKAWPAWRSKAAKERAIILQRWADLIDQHIDDLAYLLTLEQGKPLAEAKGEVAYGNSYIKWFVGEALRINGDVISAPKSGDHIVTIKQSIGVVAAITPWNFPSAMITRKCAPALAAGCPVIIKPAEDTPYSAFALAVLAEKAGFPAGVINILTGIPAEIGIEMTNNPLVRKVSFTGSTRVGKILMRQSANTVKKVSLELGGNAPFIVFDDANIEAAIEGAMASKFRNSGQTCICANRIFIQDSIYEVFSEKLAEKVSKIKVGNGFEDNIINGPLINQAALDKVIYLVEDAKNKGAKILIGGKIADQVSSLCYEPTVLTDVNKEMEIFNTEIFGPVAALYRFKTEEEAIALANDTPFGLASYFYAQNIDRIWRVSEGLEYGMVGVNAGIISSEAAPFGGIKESGIGREGSKYGIEEYLEIKYLYMANQDL